jgi:cysteine desulfurase
LKIYLDNNATTPINPEVKEVIAENLEIYGNPSSLHDHGVKARNAIETSRELISQVLGCKADEIYFTSGGSESNNIAIQGYLKTTGKKHIITSKIEHPAVLSVFKYLEKNGYSVSWIDVDENGRIDADDVASALTEDTAFVSIMSANNETGTIQPIKEIVAKIKEFSADIVFHTDAVQGFGKINIDVKDLNVDMLSISAHKINGPKGVGALYIRKGIKIKPIYLGGHHERGIRPGTENVSGIAGLGKAAEIAGRDIDKNSTYLNNLKARLKNGIANNIKNVKVNGHEEYALPNTLNVSFRNIEGEAIIMMLDMEGISVSSGSACSSGTLEASHVLLAMGIDHATAQGSIRFSLGRYNTEDEIDYVVEKLPPVVNRLREMSPLES